MKTPTNKTKEKKDVINKAVIRPIVKSDVSDKQQLNTIVQDFLAFKDLKVELSEEAEIIKQLERLSFKLTEKQKANFRTVNTFLNSITNFDTISCQEVEDLEGLGCDKVVVMLYKEFTLFYDIFDDAPKTRKALLDILNESTYNLATGLNKFTLPERITIEEDQLTKLSDAALFNYTDLAVKDRLELLALCLAFFNDRILLQVLERKDYTTSPIQDEDDIVKTKKSKKGIEVHTSSAILVPKAIENQDERHYILDFKCILKHIDSKLKGEMLIKFWLKRHPEAVPGTQRFVYLKTYKDILYLPYNTDTLEVKYFTLMSKKKHKNDIDNPDLWVTLIYDTKKEEFSMLSLVGPIYTFSKQEEKQSKLFSTLYNIFGSMDKNGNSVSNKLGHFGLVKNTNKYLEELKTLGFPFNDSTIKVHSKVRELLDMMPYFYYNISPFYTQPLSKTTNCTSIVLLYALNFNIKDNITNLFDEKNRLQALLNYDAIINQIYLEIKDSPDIKLKDSLDIKLKEVPLDQLVYSMNFEPTDFMTVLISAMSYVSLSIIKNDDSGSNPILIPQAKKVFYHNQLANNVDFISEMRTHVKPYKIVLEKEDITKLKKVHTFISDLTNDYPFTEINIKDLFTQKKSLYSYELVFMLHYCPPDVITWFLDLKQTNNVLHVKEEFFMKSLLKYTYELYDILQAYHKKDKPIFLFDVLLYTNKFPIIEKSFDLCLKEFNKAVKKSLEKPL